MSVSAGHRYSDQMARRVRSLQRGSFDSLLRGGVYSEGDARAVLPYLEVRYDPSGYCIAVVRVRRSPGASLLHADHDAPPVDDAERVLRVHVGDRGYVYRRNADELVVFFSDSDPANGSLRRRIQTATVELESRSGATLDYGIGGWRTALVDAGLSLRDAEHQLCACPSTDPDRADQPGAPCTDTGLCGREPTRSVQQYILRHFVDPDLTLGTIARHFDLSETYLSQAFRQHTAATYSSFLERVRVEAARRLLDEGVLAVGEICTRVGYQTSSTLFRAFRRIHGRSPSAYRSAHRIEDSIVRAAAR